MEYPEIKFDQIRKGDTIQQKHLGLTITGVAHSKSGGCAYWLTEEGGAIAETGETHYLIDRPTPPLPTEPGTVFRATEIRGIETSVIVFVRYGTLISVPVYVSANRVNGRAEHTAHHITAWEPIEVSK